ncbi:MAG TPA: ATP-binding protein [Actinoplanes sp.]|nr:ATP-binding protein [Actinoplanes sp.]
MTGGYASDGRTLIVEAAAVTTVSELGALLRRLRLRLGHRKGRSVPSYRELANANGWSHGAVGGYLSGLVLPPVDRFDTLVLQLGASEAEQGALASARDRVDERRRSTGPATDAPCFLPVALPSFIGRTAELAALDTLHGEYSRAGVTTVAVICGGAGIGKTSLAAQWARQAAPSFPGGRFLIDLRGFSPHCQPLSAEAVMRTLLGYVGVPDSAQPPSIAAQAGVFQRVLDRRRALVVLDNVVDADQVRPLLSAMRDCLVLITSRYDLPGLVADLGARAITLGLPTRAESRRMLEERIGRSRTNAEPTALDDIIASCARLPLAMAVVAARAATRPHFSLAEIGVELRGTETCLTSLETGDETMSVPAALTWSYQRVSDTAGRLFRLLSVHPGPDLAVAAAASLSALPVNVAQAGLSELSRVHLVSENAGGRYGLHDLIRAFAGQLVQATEVPAARVRMLDHYLYAVRAVAGMLDPGMPVADSGLPSVAGGTVRPDFPDKGSALAWLFIERDVLLAVLNTASRLEPDPRIWLLARCLGEFVDRRAEQGITTAELTAVLARTQQYGDPAEEAHARLVLGRLLRETDRGAARMSLERALDLYQAQADYTGQGKTCRALSVLSAIEGDIVAENDFSVRAMQMFWAAGLRAGTARGLEGLGYCYRDTGRPEEAVRFAAQADTLRAEPRRARTRAAHTGVSGRQTRLPAGE